MGLYRKLKLYRFVTVWKYMKASWKNSAFVKTKSGRNRLIIYFDLIYWFVRYGFDFNDYCAFKFWDKTIEQRKGYISFRRNVDLGFQMSSTDSYSIFLDKARFNERFKNYVKREWLDLRVATEQEVERFLERHATVILKPLDDYGGHGVTKTSDKRLVFSTIGGGKSFIIEELIENHEEIKQLAPGSLNTLRFVTVLDQGGQLHIIASLLRMGNGKSHTDNYHDGGMACPIDINSGCLTEKAYGMDCVEFSTHPHSGICFNSYKVPRFEECLKLIEEIVRVEPNARYVGWDLAITPNGIDLLEGNIPPGEDITQIATGKGIYHEILNWK